MKNAPGYCSKKYGICTQLVEILLAIKDVTKQAIRTFIVIIRSHAETSELVILTTEQKNDNLSHTQQRNR